MSVDQGTSSNRAMPSFDFAVIGAGVVGAAIARDLIRHRDSDGNHPSVVLLDARADVGDGTSKANTAIWHTGFDATPGTLESRLVARGYHLLEEHARTAGIALETTGALLIAWDADQLEALPQLAEKAERNGYHDTRMVDVAELAELEPHLGPGALGALSVPGEGIIDPWSVTTSLAYEFARRGGRVMLNAAVTSVRRDSEADAGRGNAGDADGVDSAGDAGGTAGADGVSSAGDAAGAVGAVGVSCAGGAASVLETTAGAVRARWVINVAGLSSDAVDRLLGVPADESFTVTPRRGQLVVFDKLARPLVNHVLLPVPSKLGKGVLISPTVFGNVMLGPTAEDLSDKNATETTESGYEFLRGHAQRILPDLLNEEVTAMYAGMRAATDESDYRIRAHPDVGAVTVGGIRSTGLTASLAIAEYVVGLLVDAGEALANPDEPNPERMIPLGESQIRDYQTGGEVICHCERVTRGDLQRAMTAPVPPTTLDGLRRRTRGGNGRCQQFWCGARLREMLGVSES